MDSDQPPVYTHHTNSALITCIPPTKDITEESSNCDNGSELPVNDLFEDKTVRIGFIQKVLGIKFLQMLAVTVIFGIFKVTEKRIIRHMTNTHDLVHLITLTGMACIATNGLLLYCDKARRVNPYRYLFLAFTPITAGVFVSVFTIGIYDWLLEHRFFEIFGSIVIGWGTHTMGVLAVFCYTEFALQTKLKAIKYNVVLATVLQICVYACLYPLLFYIDCRNDCFNIIVVLFLFPHYIYLFWDLDLMTSKKYWDNITPNDFVDGAVNLNLDCYYIFINIIIPKFR